jgi:hypothetical protein
MTDEILESGDWWRVGISGKAGPPVPYPPADRPDGARNHGFVDLRANPALVLQIPEVRDSPGMQAVLTAINAPLSPLRSFGCEHTQPSALGAPVADGPSQSMGSYIDLAFVDADLNTKDRILELARRIVTMLPMTVANWTSFDLLAERLKYLAGREDRYGLFVRLQGYGRDEDEARRVFESSMTLLAQVFDQLSQQP